ncbi:MAG: lipopolysaccharide biosynthesis protein [Acidobacteria bacterium]|nr:lipopolysaccharide biosynthesis protein [Acidobacteriota bacterium]MBS1864955.1 lipopolysaccharide biosynthesis protein [Acidobacteriota bacterium]
MVRNGEISLADIKRILRRYWWIPTFVTLAVGVASLAVALILPKKYTSSTLVLIEQPAVPKDVIKPVITDDLNQQMASMKAQILSRSRLEQIINKFNLYAQERASHPIDDLVEKLKASIDVQLIQPITGSNNHEPPGFNVSVTFNDPLVAQHICQEITSMFMEQNASNRVIKSKGTTDFLTQQVNEAKAKLDEQDRKLAEFKTKHPASLPEREQTNLTLLAGMNGQLDATAQALMRAQQDKSLNETLLAQQEAAVKAAQAGQLNTESQDQELALLQTQLSNLLARYTPEHPDVIKTKAQIEDLKKKMAQPAPVKTASGSEPSLREPPAVQQLKIRIKQDELNIADLTKRQGQIQDQIRVQQGLLQASPVIEQQLKELTRNYQTASDIYNELLKSRENSAMATDMEHNQEGENFKVLDAPSLPASPSFPKKSVFAGGGLGAGFALSLGILYLLALSDKTMYTERDIEVCLRLPVLAMVQSFDAKVAHVSSLRSK